jgi:hypothetical protein
LLLRSAASASTASSGRLAAEGHQQLAGPGVAGPHGGVGAARVELVEVDAERDLDEVGHAEAAELGGRERRGADDRVEGLGGAHVEPVGQRVAFRHAPDAEQAAEALVGDHHRPDAALPCPPARPAEGGAVGDLDPVGLEIVEEPGQLAPPGHHAVAARAGQRGAGQRDDAPLRGHRVGALATGNDQHGLVAGPLVSLAEVAQRRSETAGVGRHEVGQADDAHAANSKITIRLDEWCRSDPRHPVRA